MKLYKYVVATHYFYYHYYYPSRKWRRTNFFKPNSIILTPKRRKFKKNLRAKTLYKHLEIARGCHVLSDKQQANNSKRSLEWFKIVFCDLVYKSYNLQNFFLSLGFIEKWWRNHGVLLLSLNFLYVYLFFLFSTCVKIRSQW